MPDSSALWTTTIILGDVCCFLVQSSHKLQVVVVCDEPLPRITYLARQVEVQPLTAEAAAQMLSDAQPTISEVGGVCQNTCSLAVSKLGKGSK